MLRLGGLRINPRTNGPHRNAAIAGITLKTMATGASRAVTLPANSTLLPIGFSPDGKRYAFGRIGASSIELWMADVTTAKAARTGTAALNAAGATGGPFGLRFCEWLDDSSALACLTVPANRAAVPAPPTAPDGPNIQETSGKPAPVRTYQDLLTSAYDEALFEYYLTSQLALIDPASGKVTPIGKPGMIEEPAPSPDGRFFLVSRTKRPFSRLVPRDDFPKDIEVWSRTGEKVRTIADVPMGDAVPITGVITGPRGAEWHAAAPATLVWVEALDGGNLKNKVPHRDRVMTLSAPFGGGEPSELVRMEHRFRGIEFTARGQALVTEFDRNERWTRTWLLASASTGGADKPMPRKVWDRSAEDAYADPGEPLARPGSRALLQHGDSIYLVGKGSSPEGRSSLPRSPRSRHAEDRAPVPLRQQRLRARRRPPRRQRPVGADAARVEDRGPELLRADAPRFGRRGPARADELHRSDAAARGHPEAGDPLQAQRRPRAVRDDLHAGRLHARQGRAAPDAALGVSAGVHVGARGGAGEGLAEPLHRRSAARATCSC